MRQLLAFACALVSLAAGARAAALQEPDAKPPDLFATAHKAYGWKSKNGLRFYWWLPKDLDPAAPKQSMSIVLHGRGFDYTWGWRNHPAETFRPDDVVLTVDGTSADGDKRWFAPEPDDADAFRAFLVEAKATFKIERVFLYGHSHGGAFALYYAGLHGEDVAGVAAHAAIPPPNAARADSARGVAIAFLSGTIDPDTSWRDVLDARDAYVASGFPLVHLRRLEGSSYEPDPVRANEALAWCDAMTANAPEKVLAIGLAMLRPPETKTPGGETPIDFSGAREVLRRLEGPAGKSPVALADVPPDVLARAKPAIDALEAAGAEHVAVLRKAVPKKKDLRLAATVPLGHIVPLREDMRGIDSVEEFYRAYGWDALAASQHKTGIALIETWTKPKGEPKATFDAILEQLARAWAVDGLPFDLADKMREWHGRAQKLGLTSKGIKKYPELEAWAEAWQEGRAGYVALTKKWTWQ